MASIDRTQIDCPHYVPTLCAMCRGTFTEVGFDYFVMGFYARMVIATGGTPIPVHTRKKKKRPLFPRNIVPLYEKLIRGSSLYVAEMR